MHESLLIERAKKITSAEASNFGNQSYRSHAEIGKRGMMRYLGQDYKSSLYKEKHAKFRKTGARFSFVRQVAHNLTHASNTLEKAGITYAQLRENLPGAEDAVMRRVYGDEFFDKKIFDPLSPFERVRHAIRAPVLHLLYAFKGR